MSDAALAARLFALDPGMGALLRGPAGAARDAWLAEAAALLPGAPWRRMPPGIGDERLLGGLDLAATLAAGRPVMGQGLLAEAAGGVVVAPMAERLPAGTAARIAAALDGGAALGVVALDEGEGDEAAPAALADRLALHIALPPLPPGEGRGEGWCSAGSATAPEPAFAGGGARPNPSPQPSPGGGGGGSTPVAVTVGDDVIEALCATALALGIASIRAPLLAARVARAVAALDDRTAATLDDAAVAARLVLAPRATQLPAEAAPPPEQPDSTPDQPDDTPGEDSAQAPPADIVLEAARAALPPGLLAAPDAAPRTRTPAAGKSGALQRSRRGRPAGTRPGDPRRGDRLNVVETLRAAAPWQRIRGAEPGRTAIRRDDFRVMRTRQRSETTTVFVVDASGSAAAARLAEAKGAVELLLADCYIRRDQVAVVSFRGRGAELLLPPTRSLVRAKRSLAGLPGGGGTPLAAGLQAAGLLAAQVRRRGGTPTLVLLTDGRANVGADGRGGRARAEEDAMAAARAIRADGTAALFVDTSARPNPVCARLAAAMAARYVPLPYADARAVSGAVRAAR